MNIDKRQEFISDLKKMSLSQLETKVRQVSPRNLLPFGTNRLVDLFKFLNGEKDVGLVHAFDIEEYLLRSYIRPENFAPTYKNPYIKSDLLDYDPAKNGANIIKHGIAFSEAMSYSNKWGILTAGPVFKSHNNQNTASNTSTEKIYQDKERVVVFSDLVVPTNYQLAIPHPRVDFTKTNYTISVIDQTSVVQKFISTRILSKKPQNARKSIQQAFSGMKISKDEKDAFVERCLEILSPDLNFNV